MNSEFGSTPDLRIDSTIQDRFAHWAFAHTKWPDAKRAQAREPRVGTRVLNDQITHLGSLKDWEREPTMKINIDQLTEVELIDLNNRIVERLKFLAQMRAHSEMLEFSVGDRVTFSPDGRGPISGVLTKYNRKTVTVITDGGQRWNVSPSFLRRSGASKESRKGSNVISLKKE
jgi:hypothetical protein